MNFSDLGLAPGLLKAVEESGYHTPTPIQQRAIPAILQGGDLMAAAQTGTGKTAGFTLPLLQLLAGKDKLPARHIRALVVTPTRELALQVQDNIRRYSKYEKLSSAVVFGGVNINPQKDALQRGVDILVATPGRLLDLYQQGAVSFKTLEILVLDEADRMLDMGFIHDIRKLLALLPQQRQNLLFSATFSDPIRKLARQLCKQPAEIDVAPRNSTVERISQHLYHVDKPHKLPLLASLLLDTPEQVLVFSRTKHGANNMVKKLAGFGIQAAAIHGNKSQAQRTKVLDAFRKDELQVLVATDIAARGIDIQQLAMVINYDLPQVPEDYVHRIGRTGRAGASGLAVSLVSTEDRPLLKAIERLIKLQIDVQEVPYHDLPVATVQAEPEAPRTPASKPKSQQGRGRQSKSRAPAANRGQEKPAGSSGRRRRRRSRQGRQAA